MVPVTLEGGGKTMGAVPCVVVELVSKAYMEALCAAMFRESDEGRETPY
jgi:hypothetical protein